MIIKKLPEAQPREGRYDGWTQSHYTEPDSDYFAKNRELIVALLERHKDASRLREKLARPDGLCTSVAHNGNENAQRMRFILDAWEAGEMLEVCERTGNKWLAVRYDSPPMEFESHRYRIAQ